MCFLVSHQGLGVFLTQNSGNDRSSIASESFQIEANATTIVSFVIMDGFGYWSKVRAAEELLFVTRSLKEAWILGQIRPFEGDENDEQRAKDSEKKANELVDAILRD